MPSGILLCVIKIKMNTHSTLKGTLALFRGKGKPFEIHTSNVRDLQPGEILVKNLYTTICGSDIHTYCGLRNEPCPSVLGHEIAGEIVSIHPGHKKTDLAGLSLNTGDRITWTIFSSNPNSAYALAGMPQKGDQLFKYGHALAQEPEMFHGGLAEYCILKANTGILKLPEQLSLPVAATLNCSVATVAGAVRMAGNVKDKTVLVTGMGHLGITCVAMCKDAGAREVIALDVDGRRLQHARAFGADYSFNLNAELPLFAEYVQQLPNAGIDIAFDMSGSPDAMELGVNHLSIGGTAVWIGAVFNTRKVELDAEKIIRRLISIKGLHNYNFDDFRYALDFITRSYKRFPFDKAIEKEFTLEQVNEAFEYAVNNKPLRVGINLQQKI